MNTSEKFWNKMANRYSQSPIENVSAYQNKLELTKAYLTPETKLLEFGCGTGSTSLILANSAGNIHAIDSSSKMIEISKQKCQELSIKNINFECISIDNLEEKDESYDVILGMSILHLLEDKDSVIKKVTKLLKPGGVFISSTACLGDHMAYFKLIGPIGHFLRLMPKIAIFSRNQLDQSITMNGLNIVHRMIPDNSKTTYFVIAQK